MNRNHNANWTRPARLPLAALTLLLMSAWMLPGTGCTTRRPAVREIPADRMVQTLRAGVPFTPAVDGKFVPLARWNEMLDVYIQHSLEKR